MIGYGATEDGLAALILVAGGIPAGIVAGIAADIGRKGCGGGGIIIIPAAEIPAASTAALANASCCAKASCASEQVVASVGARDTPAADGGGSGPCCFSFCILPSLAILCQMTLRVALRTAFSMS